MSYLKRFEVLTERDSEDETMKEILKTKKCGYCLEKDGH